jgi:uncharacterized protein YigE (DUF2233 family)
MIKVTYKHTPTNFTSLMEKSFNTLEEVVRFHATTEKICLYAVEEEGVGYHLVHLNKNNTVALEPFLCFYMYEGKFREISSGRYSPLPFHVSENYKEAIKNVEAEMAVVKLA